MALVTHQVQGAIALNRPSLKKGSESKIIVATFPIVKRTDYILLNHRSRLSLKTPLSKRKSLKISSFKGNTHTDEPGGLEKGLRSTKNPVKLSYVSKVCNEIVAELPRVKNGHATPTPTPNPSPISDVDEAATGSIAIQQLFKSWLTLLRAPSESRIPDGTMDAGSFSNGTVETGRKIQNRGIMVILKAVWRRFLSLDPAIKIPAMIFIPMYLAVNTKYGLEVVKELTPLWACGPLLVALYIKIVQGLWLLYIYSFNQSVKVVNNLPMYYNYAFSGKLKGTIHARLWQPMADCRKLGFKGMRKRGQEWIVDKYLDCIESVWPRYCKFIRFMKRANFI